MSPRRLIDPAAGTARAARWRAGGFTLIELLVTIAIAAILLALVAPSFDDASAGSKTSDIATRLAVATNAARGEAIKRNGRAVLCISADGDTCAGSGGWDQGWIVFHDRNQNGSRDANADPALDDTVVLKESAITSGYKVLELDGKTSFNFPATGIGMNPDKAEFTVCRALPSVAPNQRKVLVGATGKSSIRKVTSTTCS